MSQLFESVSQFFPIWNITVWR